MMILHVDKNFSKLYLVYSSRLMFCEKIRKYERDSLYSD